MKKLFTLLVITLSISMVLGFAFEPFKSDYNNTSVVWMNQQSLTPTPQNIMATTLISPTVDGGFETGSTFALNN